MQNCVQEGSIVTLTAPYTVASGAGALVGTVFGVATADVTSGATGEFQTEGVFDLARAGSQTFTQGSAAYWSDANKNVTAVVGGNIPIGYVLVAGSTGDATVRVVLNNARIPRVFVSAEQTGTGSAQNVAHGLGFVPSRVFVTFSDLTPATVGSAVVTMGSHTSTNVVVTVTASKKFYVVAEY